MSEFYAIIRGKFSFKSKEFLNGEVVKLTKNIDSLWDDFNPFDEDFHVVTVSQECYWKMGLGKIANLEIDHSCIYSKFYTL